MGGATGSLPGLGASRSGPGEPGRPPFAGRAGRIGLLVTSLSVLATFAVAVLGPSVMEPALPGRAGPPPWAFGVQPSPVLAVALAAAALAMGTLGLGLCLHATHRGWSVSPRAVLLAGMIAAAAMALVPPFGSSDQLSYAAYGRMAVTGHDPYTTTPAVLARLGDPVAAAVQDWRHSPSVYGSLATGGQALASLVGGTSARLTVFILALLNLAAFVATGLLLHRLTRGSRSGQLRAALLWTFNPLLLQVLVAGAHVDSQAIAFGVAALTVFTLGTRGAAGPSGAGGPPSARRQFLAAAAAGALAGLGVAVKLTMILVPAGLAVAVLAVCWPRRPSGGRRPPGLAGGGSPGLASWGGAGDLAPWRRSAVMVGGLAAGLAVTVAAALIPWGVGSLRPALRAGSYVSIGSPWRTVRFALRLAAGEGVASDLVKAAAIVLAVLLLILLLRPLRAQAAAGGDVAGDLYGAPDLAVLAAGCTFAFVFAWLIAWPYVLPWYDGLGWAFLALLPVPARPGAARPGAVRAGPVQGVSAWSGPGLPVRVFDWLLLARTATLAFGYLPARGDIIMPSDLGWLRPVVRNGVTPVILLAVTVAVVLVLWPQRRPAGT